jgi:hypothetical protein
MKAISNHKISPHIQSNYFLTILVLFLSLFLFNQSNSQTLVSLSGRSFDKESRNLPIGSLMIINKRTNSGTFADVEGKFTLNILQSDTLIFSAIGFRVKKVCLKDSIARKQYIIEVPLQKISYELKEVSVFADRSLNEIQKDIDRLGKMNTYSVTGVNAIESPITALYERFSKIGKAKQKVSKWENEDLKRDILKDLFRVYIKFDVIELNDDQFDDFIRYLNLSDEFIQNATQFELVMAIKGRYESYKYRWH